MRIISTILIIFCSSGLPTGVFAAVKNIDETAVSNTASGISDDLHVVGKDELTLSNEMMKKFMDEKKAVSFLLGKSNKGRNIEGWFFPGSSGKKALVIGGVHGSELSSLEVARALIQKLLRRENTFYNVIIIPCLFPDNALLAKEKNKLIGSTANIGRYSFPKVTDPNRQMPTPGVPFCEDLSLDHFGRTIEKENRLLLQLINLYKPERIASIHAIRDIQYAGIFADPRTDHKGYALGFASDSMLAISMANMIRYNNGFVPGNLLDKSPNALYYKDPAPVGKGEFQKRNISGSLLPGNRESGISLGTWASTAIASDADTLMNRNAIRILTIEFPGYKRPSDYKYIKQKNYFRLQVQLYAAAIEHIFLGEFFIEENENSPELNLTTAR